MKTLNMMAGGGMNTAQELAEMLRQMGRGRDSILAHITPEEAQMLLQMGGSGKINPNTGLPEFQQDDDIYDMDIPGAGGTVAEQQAAIQSGFYEPSSYIPGAQITPITPSNIGVTPLQPGVASRGIETTAAPQQSAFASYLPPDTLQELQTADYLSQRVPTSASGQVFTAPTGTGLEQRLQQLEAFARRNPLATQLGVGLAQALMARQAAKPLGAQARQMRERADRTRAMALEAQQRAQAGGLTAAEQRRLQTAQARARQGLGERGMAQGSAAAGILASQEARVRGEAKEQSLDEYARLMGLVDQDLINAANLDLKRDQYLSDLAAKVLTGLVTTPRQVATPPRG
jgi:hypothetical protein